MESKCFIKPILKEKQVCLVAVGASISPSAFLILFYTWPVTKGSHAEKGKLVYLTNK